MCVCFFLVLFALYSFVVGIYHQGVEDSKVIKGEGFKANFLLSASFVFVFYFPYLSTLTKSAPPNIFSNFQVSTS